MEQIAMVEPKPSVRTPRQWWERAGRCWARFLHRAEDGASAVEFAILASVLVPGCILTADIGLAVNERMTMDHVLRAGAQSVMDGKSAAEILRVLEATAAANFGEAARAGDEALGLKVEAVDGGLYRLTATRTYKGLLLDRYFEPSLYIQIP